MASVNAFYISVSIAYGYASTTQVQFLVSNSTDARDWAFSFFVLA
jgi:hypothetical protein